MILYAVLLRVVVIRVLDTQFLIAFKNDQPFLLRQYFKLLRIRGRLSIFSIGIYYIIDFL
jgi:hypothetical protein